MKRARRFLLVVCFFVCPLIFFTNLTRNPYITQISLLNICLLLSAALVLAEGAREGRPALPRTPLDIPLLAWLAVCLLSWLVAYLGHADFYKPAMRAEGGRAFLFLAFNALVPFYLGALGVHEDGDHEPAEKTPLGAWVAFVLTWGLLWTAFPQARGPAAASADVWGQVWDGYGALLWAGGLAWALWLCRRGRWISFLHLALATGFLASAYGILQYFNLEVVWPHALNPYGGRSVSTFGNPNFMSSFNVILLPAAGALFAVSRGPRRLAYGILLLVLEGALLCSLTRSSWLGAAVAAGVLFLSPDLRRRVREEPRPFGLLFGLGAAMALLWPQSSVVSGYTPSVLGRVAEIAAAAKETGPYSPWHQRLLIWSCAWLMGAENPLTGKGWGLFELFYPFYQGHLVEIWEFFRPLRTHANNAHNEILEVWAQAGLLGVGVLLWVWAAFAAAARRALRSGSRLEPALLAALAAGVAGMLADNMLNVSLHFAVPGFLFWWVAGSAMGACARPGRPFGAGGGAPSRAGLLLGAAVAAGLSWYWVKVWNREARYFAGFKLLRQGVMPAAARQLELSRAWGPREVNAIYELGNAYARSERFEKAGEAYREALRANSGYDEIYYNLGVVESSRLGHAQVAIDFLRVSRAINPLSPEVYTTLGNLYLQEPGRYREDAVGLLSRAVRIFPDNANHWNNLGYLHSLARRAEDAERAYTRALTLDPAMAIAERNLAALAAQSGRPRAAILDALSDLREVDRRAARRDFSDSSLELARRAARAAPEMFRARFMLGTLLLARGRADQALPHLEWAAARRPESAPARVNLGAALMGLGRADEARRELRAAQSLEPGNDEIRKRLQSLGL